MVSKDFLITKIQKIHVDCNKLCMQSFGNYLSNAGNVGIFSQSEEEYNNLTLLKNKLTLPASNPNQKYFELIDPISIPGEKSVPDAQYTHLYIRRPDKSDYGNHRGDIDFYVTDEEYKPLLEDARNNNIQGARIYKQEGVGQLIELYGEGVDSLAYVSTKEMTKSLRVKH